MLIIMSPTKTFHTIKGKQVPYSLPIFREEARAIIAVLQTYNLEQIKELMDVSDKIAQEVHTYYEDFEHASTAPAIESYYGEAFKALEFHTLDDNAYAFARKHLAILSGLYGVLGAVDQIAPYRLEVGNKKFQIEGKHLYSFWKDKVSDEIIKRLEALNAEKILLNLASKEYTNMLDLKKINKQFRCITIIFKEKKGEVYKVISMYTKTARGSLLRYILENNIHQIEMLKKFRGLGYMYREELSSTDEWVFVRE